MNQHKDKWVLEKDFHLLSDTAKQTAPRSTEGAVASLPSLSNESKCVKVRDFLDIYGRDTGFCGEKKITQDGFLIFTSNKNAARFRPWLNSTRSFEWHYVEFLRFDHEKGVRYHFNTLGKESFTCIFD